MAERPQWTDEAPGDGAVPPKYRGVPEEFPEEGVVYRHYKGDLYRVITNGCLSEARGIHMTAYFSLKLKRVWMRPTKMFLEEIVWPDGKRRRRFEPDAAFKKSSP